MSDSLTDAEAKALIYVHATQRFNVTEFGVQLRRELVKRRMLRKDYRAQEWRVTGIGFQALNLREWEATQAAAERGEFDR